MRLAARASVIVQSFMVGPGRQSDVDASHQQGCNRLLATVHAWRPPFHIANIRTTAFGTVRPRRSLHRGKIPVRCSAGLGALTNYGSHPAACAACSVASSDVFMARIVASKLPWWRSLFSM